MEITLWLFYSFVLLFSLLFWGEGAVIPVCLVHIPWLRKDLDIRYFVGRESQILKSSYLIFRPRGLSLHRVFCDMSPLQDCANRPVERSEHRNGKYYVTHVKVPVITNDLFISLFGGYPIFRIVSSCRMKVESMISSVSALPVVLSYSRLSITNCHRGNGSVDRRGLTVGLPYVRLLLSWWEEDQKA